jgi:hypothetical protein
VECRTARPAATQANAARSIGASGLIWLSSRAKRGICTPAVAKCRSLASLGMTASKVGMTASKVGMTASKVGMTASKVS